MAYSTVTLTGTYKLPDGTPAQGTVEVIPSEKKIIDSAGNVILSGRVKVKLDELGHFTVDLPATDDISLNPTGFGYAVVAKLHHTHLPAVSFSLPAAVPVVDMADVESVDPSTFTPGVTYVTPEQLSLKANTADVDTALATKANTTDVNSALALKANASSLAAKADATRVDSLETLTNTGRLSDTSLSATIVRDKVRQPFGETQVVPLPTIHSYKPAALAAPVSGANYTYTDVDPANLVLRAIVPPSGRILLRLTAKAQCNASASFIWAVKDSSGVLQESVGMARGFSSTSTPVDSVCVAAVITKDGAGNSLVPGAQVTWTWVHTTTAAGITGTTQYGGGSGGAAVMEAIPVSTRLTEAAATPALTQPGYRPLWMCHDRKTILGASNTAPALAWSTDDGATWTTHATTFAGGVSQVRELDDGELLLFVGQHAGSKATIWRSSGWKANKATATFAKVHTALGGQTVAWASWSVDTYGPIVLASEYGPKNGENDMARYSWISEDYGVTWRLMFDLWAAGVRGTTGTDQPHLHGVAYDPWWDAIWLTNGDGDTTSQSWVSFDRGRTWKSLNQDQQFTSIYALPECIIFVTDENNPNGFYRIPRVSKDLLRWEIAYIQDPSAVNLTILGTQMFRARGLANAPLLMSMDAGSTGPGRLFATYDGYTFREVWTDTLTYSAKGLKHCVGPTTTGKYLGNLERDTAGGGYFMLTLTV